MSDWYEEHIEEGVRDVVRLLRDHGYNTESSCHHDMTVQVQHIPGALCFLGLHQLLWNYLHEQGEEVSFRLQMEHEVREGRHYGHSCVLIYLTGREPWLKEPRIRPMRPAQTIEQLL